jgi:hypothetical protein
MRQHLPRSPIPKMIERWERLHKDIQDIKANTQSRLNDIVAPSQFQFGKEEKAVGLDLEGLSSAIMHRLKQLSLGNAVDIPVVDVRTETAGQGMIRIFIWGWSCAVVPPEQVVQTVEFVRSVLNQVKEWPELDDFSKADKELSTLTEELREELATIVLRRVLPGRCKYCPI